MLQTCTRCRKRRIKCDSLLPACANCAKTDLECTFRDDVLQEEVPRSYIKGLYDRIEELESDLTLQQQHHQASNEAQDQSVTWTNQAPKGQSFHVLAHGGGEYLYLGLSPPALITWSMAKCLAITSALPEPRFTGGDSCASQDLSKIDRSILSPRAIRFLLGRYDQCVRPLYPIPASESLNDIKVSLKSLPHLKKFKVIVSCAIAAAFESLRNPEWRIIAKVCREWAEELTPQIIIAGTSDSVSAVLSLLVYELIDPARGILWELLGLAIRLCLQLGWHRQDQINMLCSVPVPADGLTTLSSAKDQSIAILKSIERPLRMTFDRATMFNSGTFPVTSPVEALFETYTKLSAELYGSGGVYETQSCPFTGQALAFIEVLDNTTSQDLIVQDCWLLFFPVCLEHDECAFCSTHVDSEGTENITSLRKSVLQAASHQLEIIHGSISSNNGFFSPLLASSKAFPAGCAIVAGATKGWAGLKEQVQDLMKCSEILTSCAPHWKGGRDYLDIWRTLSSSV